MSKSLGIFIPTIGGRDEYLIQTIESVKAALPKHRETTFFVLAETFAADSLNPSKLGCELVKIDSDEALPLAKKIALGVENLNQCDYVTWIGDDDLLDSRCLELACNKLDEDIQLSFVFGRCTYIDARNEPIFQNAVGEKALRVLSWGPDLIPQPGTVWRQSHYQAIGGLDTRFDMAFDFDLFLRLSKYGGGQYHEGMMSFFRWHSSSLSVSRRLLSAKEASRVRLKNAGRWILVQLALEPALILSTWVSAKLVDLKRRIKSPKP